MILPTFNGHLLGACFFINSNVVRASLALLILEAGHPTADDPRVDPLLDIRVDRGIRELVMSITS